jgi:hypothetical protein
MSLTQTPSRTPTAVTDHSDKVMSNAKPPRSSTSHEGIAPRRASDDSSVPSEKAVKATTGPQQGMVAPLQLSRWRFWAIFVSLMISIFLFALGELSPATNVDSPADFLDQLILATAIPKITEAFNSLTELSWLASGFLYVPSTHHGFTRADQIALLYSAST